MNAESSARDFVAERVHEVDAGNLYYYRANSNLPPRLTKSADKSAVLTHQRAHGDRAAQGEFLIVKKNVRMVDPDTVPVVSNEADSGHTISACACIVGVLKLAASELDCAGVPFPFEGK